MECKKDIWDGAGRCARAMTRGTGMEERAKMQNDHPVRLGRSREEDKLMDEAHEDWTWSNTQAFRDGKSGL
jgi:hypothetical protein